MSQRLTDLVTRILTQNSSCLHRLLVVGKWAVLRRNFANTFRMGTNTPPCRYVGTSSSSVSGPHLITVDGCFVSLLAGLPQLFGSEEVFGSESGLRGEPEPQHCDAFRFEARHETPPQVI